MTILYDESYQELFGRTLEVKNIIIPEIKNHQDELITKKVRQIQCIIIYLDVCFIFAYCLSSYYFSYYASIRFLMFYIKCV